MFPALIGFRLLLHSCILLVLVSKQIKQGALLHNLVCTTTSDKHSFPTLSVSRDGNVRGICQARFEEVARPSTDAASSLGLLRLAWKQEDGSRGGELGMKDLEILNLGLVN